jgi:hypothetical protein
MQPWRKEYIGLQLDQFLSQMWNARCVATAPAVVDPDVLACSPAQLAKARRERRNPGPCFPIALRLRREYADPPDAVALLRSRHHRPRHSASEPCDELPPPHS